MYDLAWWRHQIETFSALLALCAGNSPVTGEFPSQRPVTRSFDVFFDLLLNKPLSKQWRRWRFGTPGLSLWRHNNGKMPSYSRAKCVITWWRHQIETFSALLAICAGNSPVPGEFPSQKPVTRSFDVFFDLRLNKRLSKQSWGWWFETLSRPLWRHRNDACIHRGRVVRIYVNKFGNH